MQQRGRIHRGPPRSRGSRIVAAITALSVGWAWVVVLLTSGLMPGSWFTAVLLLNGPVAALYLGILYATRGTNRDAVIAALVVIVAVSHLFWLLLAGFALESVGAAIGLDDGSLMLLITAAGFAGALGLASWSLFPAAALLVAGVLAASVSAGSWDESTGLTLGCAVLHAVMVSTVGVEVVLRRPPPSPGACPKCEYPFDGLPAGSRCPECGSGREG